MRTMLTIEYMGEPIEQATAGSAGFDIRAKQSYQINPGQRVLVDTGVYLAIPPGHVGMVCPRSGLALKYGVTVANAPGIVDSDYRGELKVILVNLAQAPYIVRADERIAQLVITPVAAVDFERVDDLGETERGVGGFGSTGTV